MAEIRTEVVFGVQVKLTTPLRPSREAIQSFLKNSEERINKLIASAIGTALRSAVPGFKVEITNVKSKIDVIGVDE